LSIVDTCLEEAFSNPRCKYISCVSYWFAVAPTNLGTLKYAGEQGCCALDIVWVCTMLKYVCCNSYATFYLELILFACDTELCVDLVLEDATWLQDHTKRTGSPAP
jgi:hypothetical protein